MKKILLLFIYVCACATLPAQNADRHERMEATKEKLAEVHEHAQEVLKDWDTEHLLDSLDQEQLPRAVTGGVLFGGNTTNYLIFGETSQLVKSKMQAGFDIGGFLDFRVTKHFAIQGQLLLTTERNLYSDENNGFHLWSLGFNIPVFFLGRYGNMEKGYLTFGGGPYTHNVFASNLGQVEEPAIEAQSEQKYVSLFQNHSGIQALVGYELPMGLLFNFTYGISLSDIATFYQSNQASLSKLSMYPQKFALMIGYRWK